MHTSPDFHQDRVDEKRRDLDLARQRKIVSALEREVSKSRLQVEYRDRILSESSSEDRFNRRKALRAQKLNSQQDKPTE